MNLNKAFVLGRVAQAPELRSTQGGQPVASMTVATNRSWTDKAGNKQEVAEFHAVVIWGKLAQTAAAHLDKGALVFIEGRQATRTWTDKQGVQRKATEIVAEEIQFGPKPAGSSFSHPKSPAPEKRSKTDEQSPLLNGDEEDSSGKFSQAFGEKEPIGEPPF
jgi:single-strand DNA-binding protein